MIGPYRNVVTVGEAYQDAAKQFADIQKMKADTDFTNIRTLIGGEEIKSLVQQRDASQKLSDFMLQQQQLAPATDASGTLLSPKEASQDGLSPLHLNAMALVKRRDQVGAQLQQAVYLNAPQAKYLDNVYTNLVTQSREALNEVNKQDEKDADRIASAASDVKSAQDIKDLVDTVAQTKGQRAASAVASQFPRDANDNFVWDEGGQAQRAADRIGKLHLTMAQKLAAQNSQAIRNQTAASFAETQLRNRELQANEDRRIAAGQAAIEQRAEDRAASREDRALSQAQSISTSYKSDPLTQEAARLSNVYKSSQKYLFDAQGKEKPNSAFDASGDMALVDQYLKMAHPQYKGSVTELKSINQLTGVPQRIWQGLQNVIKGHELPRDVRYDMFNTMQRTFKEVNQQQMEREDDALNKIRNLQERGHLPTDLKPEDYVSQYAIRPPKKATASTVAAGNEEALAVKLDKAGINATVDVTGGKVVGRDGGPVVVQTKAQYDLLPSKTLFVGPDGKPWTKP